MKKKKGIMNSLKKNINGWLFLLPAVLCVYFCILRPQVLGTYWSFFNMKGYEIGSFAGLDNYRRVLSDTSFTQTLWNTWKYVLWSIVIGFFLPVIIAILMNELAHLRKTARFIIYLPSVLPISAVMLIWFMLYYPDASGLLNSILMKFGMEPYVWLQDERFTILFIVISMTWSGAGSAAMYYFAALQGINKELYEAAIIDGAGFFKRMFTVTVPHMYGIILLFLIQQIINVFSIMEQPMQMTGGGPSGASNTLGLLAYNYGFISIKPNLAMALGTIMFLMLIVVTCFYFKLDKKVQDNL